MLNPAVAHVGQAPAPHDLWGSWNADPTILASIALSIWLYQRGWRAIPRRRPARLAAYLAGMTIVIVAVVSPVDAMGRSLASAHMVQHLLLILIAPPLLVASAPLHTLRWAMPRRLRKHLGRRRRQALAAADRAAHPVVVALAHAAALWSWHASTVYQAALWHPAIHALEHVSFLTVGLGVWWLVFRAHRRSGVGHGAALALVFAVAMHGVILSALLTFSVSPWYSGYAGTTAPWGLGQLDDQRLAGAVMWITSSLVYAATAVVLLVGWISAGEDTTDSSDTSGLRVPSAG